MKFPCHSSISTYVIKYVDVVVVMIMSRYTLVTTVVMVSLLMYKVNQIIKLKSKDKYHSDARLKNCDIIIKIYRPTGRLLDIYYFNIPVIIYKLFYQLSALNN